MSAVTPLENDLRLPIPGIEWVGRLPDGAVSIETDGSYWILRASRQLQTRFEELLDRRKAGTLSNEDAQDYDAICDLDNLLSSFNRLARGISRG